MANIGNFNTDNYDDFEAGGLIPKGWYKVRVDATDYRATNAGTGHFVEVELTIFEGNHSSRKVWERFNIDNPSPKAQEIGAKKFSTFCRAAGINGTVTDTDQLLNRGLEVRIGIEVGKDGYEDRNRCNDYRAIEGYQQPGETQTIDEDDLPF